MTRVVNHLNFKFGHESLKTLYHVHITTYINLTQNFNLDEPDDGFGPKMSLIML